MAGVQFDRQKLKAVILHVCRTVAPDRLGAVKLHKLLYFLDMIFYAVNGRPVTGAQYRKRPFGPTCVPLLPILAEMEREGALRIAESDYFGLRKKDYLALVEPEPGRLSAEELAMLGEVADFVCNGHSARTISEFSHQTPWEMVGFGEEIGYETALLLFPSEPSIEAFALVEREAGALEAARSRENAVARSSYRDFRSRVRPSHPGA